MAFWLLRHKPIQIKTSENEENVFVNEEFVSDFKCKYLPHPVSSGEGVLPDEGGLSPTERYMKDYPDMFKELDGENKQKIKKITGAVYDKNESVWKL